MKKHILSLFFISATLLYSCKPEEPTITPCSTPMPTATNNSPVSVKETLVLTAEGPAGATFTWISPDNVTYTGKVISIPFDHKKAGQYSVTATVNGCESEPYFTTVTSCAGVEATGNTTVQEGDTIKLGVNFIPGTIYIWSGPNSYSDTIAFPRIPNVTFANTGKYYVRAKVGDCISPKDSLLVTVFPVTPKVKADTTKVGDTLFVQVTNPKVGTKYTFIGPANFKVEDTLGTKVAVPNVGRKYQGTWLVIASSNGLQSATATKLVAIKFNPKPCAGTTLNGVKITTIGNQCWAKLNADSAQTWQLAMKGSAVELQGKCKEGFHVPTDAEWTTLTKTAPNAQDLYDGSEGGPGLNQGFDFRGRSNLTTGSQEVSIGKDISNAVPDYWTSTSLGEEAAWTRRFLSGEYSILRNAVVITKEAKLRCIVD